MKRCLITLAVAFAATAVIAPRPANAAAEISAGIQINATADFTTPLTPYGSWIDYKSYGRCWHPAQVEADWRPYSVGSWEWTDAGWYWQSDEPWAWACYHYGSWSYDTSAGWVWIPGTDWAPAWVTWRSSDAYIGWAPCGPGLVVLAPSLFTFCDVHHFQDHFRPHDLIINNTTIINRTKVIKDFQRQTVNVDGRQRTIFANKGPGVDPIQRATGAKFTPRPISDVVRETRVPENVRRDGGQRPVEPARQPEQPRINQDTRPAEEQRRDTAPPTGKEEPRIYQRPAQKVPEPPKERPDAIPPTGKEQPRIYHETPAPNPVPEPKKEVPVPQQRPVTPPERPLPPTGREEAPRPEQHATPPVQAPADGHERDGHRDGNGQ